MSWYDKKLLSTTEEKTILTNIICQDTILVTTWRRETSGAKFWFLGLLVLFGDIISKKWIFLWYFLVLNHWPGPRCWYIIVIFRAVNANVLLTIKDSLKVHNRRSSTSKVHSRRPTRNDVYCRLSTDFTRGLQCKEIMRNVTTTGNI